MLIAAQLTIIRGDLVLSEVQTRTKHFFEK